MKVVHLSRLDADAVCEFEGIDGYIETRKCKDHSSTCGFPSDTTSSTTGYIVGGVVIAWTFIFLLFAAGLSQCLPVTAGGNRSANISFCKIPGCAANVTKVFCNDKLLFNGGDTVKCTGPPPPQTPADHPPLVTRR
ncbi:uncharacterized protein AKAME5_001936300 [Lates japonicus]|uniref:Uncharacterized protein n=1 Tax=Lates japonicus TaxID=270547 RepID=A0AAD3NB46_LATJO|nr:uncharacterized protein AKAME5_001936300 [Lates japonicus]